MDEKIKVQKRLSKNLVDFDKEKISNAITKALVKVNMNTDENIKIAKNIADEIENNLKAKNCEKISVEEIQDLVEEKIAANFNIKVAREYMTYRSIQALERIKNLELDNIDKNIIDSSNDELINENANLNARSHAGKMTKFGNENAKWFASKHLIPEKFIKLHDDGLFHIHDLDNWAIGSHNCLFIDMRPLLKTGFFTGNGSVRGANSLAVAFDLIPIIFQSQQNSQFGGVATAHIDYDLEPYVNKTFKKNFIKATRYLTYKIDTLLKYLGIEDSHIRFDKLSEILIESELINIENSDLKNHFPEYYDYAYNETVEEAKQGAQAMIHNLNTMCSRAGKMSARTYGNIG